MVQGARARLASREEGVVAPGERYSVEERTAEIEAIVAEREEVTFTETLSTEPRSGGLS